MLSQTLGDNWFCANYLQVSLETVIYFALIRRKKERWFHPLFLCGFFLFFRWCLNHWRNKEIQKGFKKAFILIELKVDYLLCRVPSQPVPACLPTPPPHHFHVFNLVWYNLRKSKIGRQALRPLDRSATHRARGVSTQLLKNFSLK